MRIVYIAGNPLIPQDSLPFRLLPQLSQQFPALDFRELDPTDTLPEEEDLLIIDTVVGIPDVCIIDDIDKIITGKLYSLHDFDLGMTLKLLKKAGRLKNVRIVGVPQGYPEDRALASVASFLRKIASE